MSNTASVIEAHNKRILQDQHTTTTAECNCRKKEICPLKGGCLTENVIYMAKVSKNKNNEQKNYIGLTERSFKDRLYKHRNSLRYRTKANTTELSKYIWDLRDRNIEDVNIEWSILDKASTDGNGSKTCNLYLTEKFYILSQQRELAEQKKRNSFDMPSQKQIRPFQRQRNATGQLRSN